MKENIAATFAILLVFMVSLQCNVIEQNPAHQIPLEGKIILTAAEPFPRNDTPADPVLALSLRTSKDYGCINYRISYDLFKPDNQFLFNILGVEIGDICLPAFGPAAASENLQIGNGRYGVRVAVGNRYDVYALTVTDSTVLLVPSDTSVSNVNGELHWRIPRKSFAYYSGTSPGDEWLSGAFDDTLRHHLNLTEIKAPAIGVWPYPITSQGHYFDAPAKFYRYRNEADFDSAGALLKTFSKTVLREKEGAGFSLVNWRNKYYYSWVLVHQ